MKLTNLEKLHLNTYIKKFGVMSAETALNTAIELDTNHGDSALAKRHIDELLAYAELIFKLTGGGK